MDEILLNKQVLSFSMKQIDVGKIGFLIIKDRKNCCKSVEQIGENDT